jgi:hypothetical protein
MSCEEFHRKSDSELNRLFCVKERAEEINPRMAELESRLPEICRALGRKGITTLKQWEKYRVGASVGLWSYPVQDSGSALADIGKTSANCPLPPN